MLRNFFNTTKSPTVYRGLSQDSPTQLSNSKQPQAVNPLEHLHGHDTEFLPPMNQSLGMAETSTTEPNAQQHEFDEYMNDDFHLFVHTDEDEQTDPIHEADTITESQASMEHMAEASLDEAFADYDYAKLSNSHDQYDSEMFGLMTDAEALNEPESSENSVMDTSAQSFVRDESTNSDENASEKSSQIANEVVPNHQPPRSPSRTASPGIHPAEITVATNRDSSPELERIEGESSDETRGRSRSRGSSEEALVARAKSLPASRHRTSLAYFASWPPCQGAKGEAFQHKEAFPSKDEPLHVWIQAYALRWAVWAMDVEDPERREQLLNNVTDKMSQAWESAIQQGYYARPPEVLVGSNGAGQEGATKRGRKRALSPSKCPAGFASDGHDKLAVTVGELAKFGLTMDRIRQRVTDGDFREGEERLEDVMSALPGVRPTITPRNWSATSGLVAAGRNLLMYCFWIVQESRKSIRTLENIKKTHKQARQIKNTEQRIAHQRERELQHLALATELTLLESQDSESSEDEEDETEKMTGVVTSDAAPTDDDEVTGVAAEPVKVMSKDETLALAQEVVAANPGQMLVDVFNSHKIAIPDLTESQRDADPAMKPILELLATMLNKSDLLVRTQHKMKTCPRPDEQLRMGYDVKCQTQQLQRDQTELGFSLGSIAQEDNRSASKLDSSRQAPKSQDPESQDFVQENDNKSAVANEVHTAQNNNAHVERAQGSQQFVTAKTAQGQVEPAGSAMVSPRPPTNQVQLVPQRPPSTMPSPTSSQVSLGSPKLSVNGVDFAESQLKQKYIDQYWVPWVANLLRNANQPALDGRLTNWQGIRYVLDRLGWNVQAKNECLRRFKMGFHQFYEAANNARPLVSTPSQAPPLQNSATASSIPHMTSTWPTDAEILASIPPQGIPGGQLLTYFGPRIMNHQKQFAQQLWKIANVDNQFYVRPREMQNGVAPQLYSVTPSRPSSIATSKHQNTLPTTLNYVDHARSVNASTRVGFGLQPQVHASRGFAFRHLNSTTTQQQDQMDDHIEDYITKSLKARKKDFYGTYVTFSLPEDPKSNVLTVGVWNFKSGEINPAFDWFYKSQQAPVNFNILTGTEDKHTPSDMHNGPRLKLKVTNPSMAQNSSQQNPYASMQGATRAVAFPNHGYGGGFMPQMPGHVNHFNPPSDGTINPQLLFQQSPQTSTQPYTTYPGTNPTRGVKRSAAKEAADIRRKKVKKQAEEDDQDDSGDYDPSADF